MWAYTKNSLGNYFFWKGSMLNIKEIAKLAGFSISTVSKVMNGKDTDISEDTRNRILQVIKEYNYSPYSNIKKREAKSLLIALLLKRISKDSTLLSGILETAKANGYSLLLNYCSDSGEDEKKTLLALARQNPDGILWENADENSRSLCDQYVGSDIPLVSLGYSKPDIEHFPVVGISMKTLGYSLTRMAVNTHHVSIVCLTGKAQPDYERTGFIEGYRSCLFDNSVPADKQFVMETDRDFSLKQILLHDISAVICSSTDVADKVYHEAQVYNVSIPEELSVLALLDSEESWTLVPELSGIVRPDFLTGEAAAQTVINAVEHLENPVVDYTKPIVVGGRSLAVPPYIIQPRILVVGPVNMDTILHCADNLQPGTTNTVSKCTNLPGGKGANQAIGVARLEVPVRLLSRIGNDNDGLTILNELHNSHIEIQYIIKDAVQSTGKAYIYVLDTGDSAISVYPGANANISSEDIDMHADAFNNVSYCLLQTEIAESTVIHAVSVCREKGIHTILKPARIHSCSPELLKGIDYFVPNEREATQMAPDCSTLEEKAALFMKMGAKAVIITLGEKGCYFRDSSHSIRFGAAQFAPVDATGAADAFIAALVCCLYRGENIVKAIQFASYAGGISITREGSQEGLIDYRSLMSVAGTIDGLITVTEI
jgi:ribokinase